MNNISLILNYENIQNNNNTNLNDCLKNWCDLDISDWINALCIEPSNKKSIKKVDTWIKSILIKNIPW